MTRLLFDATALDGRPSGAKSRLLRLAPALAAAGHEVALVVGPSFDAASEQVLRGVTCLRLEHETGVFRRVLRPRSLARVAREWRAGVVIFEALPAPHLPVPAIFVVHDLRRVHAGGLERRVALRWLRAAVRRAVRVHVVSEAARGDLVAAIPEARAKIDIVPNAVLPVDVALAPRVGPTGPFVFAAGHAEPRKGWSCVAALAAALSPSGIAVVRAGRGGERFGRVVDLGVIDDRTRDALFREAVAVVAASRLEGFGLVPLEALAAGAWVIATNIPAHREVLGDAADHFDVDDAATAALLVRAALSADQKTRAARVAAGRARALAFSPERAARAFLASLAYAGDANAGYPAANL
jgi:glycosyltransferase involved in cell wall biosynthesis